MTIKVTWIDGLANPKCKPNPAFPNGVDVDLTKGQARFCKVDLPYPAKRVGYYALRCSVCGFAGIVSTAGRPDDPRSVKIPCKPDA